MLSIAWRSGGRERPSLYHNFTTNPAPINGSCWVAPEKGYAYNAIDNPIQTLFNLSCDGWTDPEEPLNYTLHADFTRKEARVIQMKPLHKATQVH